MSNEPGAERDPPTASDLIDPEALELRLAEARVRRAEALARRAAASDEPAAESAAPAAEEVADPEALGRRRPSQARDLESDPDPYQRPARGGRWSKRLALGLGITAVSGAAVGAGVAFALLGSGDATRIESGPGLAVAAAPAMAEAVPAPAFLEVPDDPQPRLIEAALRPRARPAGFDTASASRRSAGGSDPAQPVGRFGEQIVLAGPTDPNAVYRARYGPADQTMPGGYSRTLLSDPLVAGALALGTALLVDSLLGDDDDEGDAWDSISGRPQLRRVALGRGDLAAPLWLGQGPQQRQWPGDLRRRQREARQAALYEREDALHQARERAEKAERDADAARQALREQKRRIEGQEKRQKSAKKAQRKPTDERKAREARTKRKARSTPDARQEDPGGDRSRQARARDPVQKAAREARQQQPEKQPKRQAQNQGRQKQPKKGQDGGKLAKADGKQKRCENGKKARCGK